MPRSSLSAPARDRSRRVVRLLDLPIEVLLHLKTFVELISPERTGVYALAQTCRRLNTIFALDSLDLKGDVGSLDLELNPTKNFKAKGEYDDLSIFMIALDVHSLARLVCRFRSAEFSVVAYDCWRLYFAISRLRALEMLELDFVGHEPFERPDVPDALLQTWVDTFGGLLNTVLKKGCKNLVVLNGATMVDTYQLSGSPRMPFRGKPGLDASPHGHYTRVSSSSTILPSLTTAAPKGMRSPFSSQSFFNKFLPKSSNTSLASILVSSRMLLQPPFSQWLHEVFQSSPKLTSLTVGHVIMPTSEHWAPALTLLRKAIPASRPLTSLTIGQVSPGPPLPLSALHSFLSQLALSNLTFLLLDETLPKLSRPQHYGFAAPDYGDPVLKIWPDALFLPRLQQLHAPVDYHSSFYFEFTTALQEGWIFPRTEPLPFGYIESSAECAPPIAGLGGDYKCGTIGIWIRDVLPLEFNGSRYDFSCVDEEPDLGAALEPFSAPWEVLEHVMEQSQLSRVGEVRFYSGVTDLILCSFAQFEDRLKMAVPIPAGEEVEAGALVWKGTEETQKLPGPAYRINAERVLYLVAWLAGFVDLRRVIFQSGSLEGDREMMCAAEAVVRTVLDKCPKMESVQVGTKLFVLREAR